MALRKAASRRVSFGARNKWRAASRAVMGRWERRIMACTESYQIRGLRLIGQMENVAAK
jgi:hypothetical protein